MANVAIVAPLNAIGGINSWSKNVRANFRHTDHRLVFIDTYTTTSQVTETNALKKVITRATVKFRDLFRILRDFDRAVEDENIEVVHATTSGSAGTVRDYFLAKKARARGVKSIVQCRYGTIPEIVREGGLRSRVLLHTLGQFDRIWVLDRKTQACLAQQPKLAGKIEVIPNPIDCPADPGTYPTSFRRVAFVASVIPTKGILELVQAIVECDEDITLTVTGNASEDMRLLIERTASAKAGGRWVTFTGPLENAKAREVIRSSDILALPTYYPFEAFPISILEAMSMGRLVISTDRAAIPDMLKSEDGSACGLIVKERDHQSLAAALKWCAVNPEEAREMCRRAFMKVKRQYANDVVFDLYSRRYADLAGAARRQ